MTRLVAAPKVKKNQPCRQRFSPPTSQYANDLTMKKFFFYPLILLALLRIPAQAQEKSSRWSIGLAAGPAYPLGSFAHFHTPVASGSVQRGVTAEINASYRLCPSFAATAVVNSQTNRGDGIPYQWLSPTSVTDPTNIRHNWMMTRVLAGGTYFLPLSKKQRFALLGRLLGGIQKTRTADFNFIVPGVADGIPVPGPVPGPLQTGVRTIAGTFPGVSLPWSFAYQADAGLRWKLDGRLSLMAYVGYNSSRPSKEFTYYHNNSGTIYTTVTARESFSTATLHALAGVELRL
jgi:hypothetical protein